MKTQRKFLGELLVEAEVITEEQFNKGLEIQKKDGSRIGEILISQGYLTEDKVAGFVDRQLGLI